MNARDLDPHDADAPIFDPTAFRLDRDEAELIDAARRFGHRVLAPRAAQHDRDATFPIENFRDMHPEGLLGICIPKADGGLGASYRTYCLAAAELGRYCGATALSWNMHVSSTLWTGALADDLMMTVEERAEHNERRRLHYKRIVGDGAIYSQPFSEGGAAAAGGVAFGTEAKPVDGGFLVSGKKIFASLSGAADFYGVLCTERGEGEGASRRNTLYLAIPADAEGVSVVGDWDPLGMRGTVSRTLVFKDVFVPEDEMLMPRGVYFRAATSWPHMFLTLSPTYMGLAQAAYDFTVRYLRGELPGTPPVKRRMYPTKQIAVAEMRVMLEQTKALWFQAVSEARANPTKDQVLRAYAAQFTVMENANALAAKAIRTCGGQAMLKSLALGAHLPRQPLRLPDAALDGGDLPRSPGPRKPVRGGRKRRVKTAGSSGVINAGMRAFRPARILATIRAVPGAVRQLETHCIRGADRAPEHQGETHVTTRPSQPFDRCSRDHRRSPPVTNDSVADQGRGAACGHAECGLVSLQGWDARDHGRHGRREPVQVPRWLCRQQEPRRVK